MGRRTTLTDAVWRSIIDTLENGHTLAHAAVKAGVGSATVREWIARGEGNHTRRATPRYAAFAADVQAAREHVESTLLNSIYRVATGDAEHEPDHRAAVELLRLLYPRRYGKRVRMEIDDLRRAADRVAEEFGVEAGGEAVLRRAEEIARAAGAEAL